MKDLAPSKRRKVKRDVSDETSMTRGLPPISKISESPSIRKEYKTEGTNADEKKEIEALNLKISQLELELSKRNK